MASVSIVGGCDMGAERGAGESAPAAYVGGEACFGCHATEARAWRGSDHDLAMQAAAPATVLGDFDSAELVRGGAMRFFRDGDAFKIRAEGPDGAVHEHDVRYTFGAHPLQQYLVEMPGGRYQALTIAWDTRPAAEGGQRWFDLHRGEDVGHGDPLHWTSALQTWNSACADCHSTNLEKRYDAATDAFATTWSDVDVGCEACHGPGSQHVEDPESHPLALPAAARHWSFGPSSPIARREPAPADGTELETCAACHSRRSQLGDEHRAGDPLLAAYRPALLEEGLYHADGQIQGEVFEYGSFLQSAMHAAGVTCSDCHEPHGTQLRFEGNAVCAQCHLPAAFDTPAHHRHAAGEPGTRCVDCHMPATTYMVVDPRRDHSFRVPRPDLSAKLGTPNPCGGCHGERTAEWAAETVAAWFPEGRAGTFHYAEAIAAARSWSADRGRLLERVLADTEVPPIVRATALALASEQLDDALSAEIERALDDDEAPVRLAALDAVGEMPGGDRVRLAQRFLTDPLRALRIEAARVLAPFRSELGERRRRDFDAALEELRAAERFNGDRAEGLFNSSIVLMQLGRLGEAEPMLRRAIEREPAYAPAYVNLAELYRRTGREDEAMSVLEDGAVAAPEDAAVRAALGFARVRSGDLVLAVADFARAAELAPDEPRYAYVMGVALHSAGETERALAALEDAHRRFPGRRDLLLALATMERDAGRRSEAAAYARRMLELSPADAEAQALLAELE